MIETLLQERGQTHGDFPNTAGCAQELKSVLAKWARRAGKSPDNAAEFNPVMCESIDMICTKLARIVSGNAFEAEHWNDIAGYSTLAAKEL